MLFILFICCTQEEAPTITDTSETIDAYVFGCPQGEELSPLGSIDSSNITETSGIGQSKRNPQNLWLHNDSGDGSFLYSISMNGSRNNTIELDTVAIDWEDMAMVQLPENPPYIYVGDIGDNDEIRTSISIHKLIEPEEETNSPLLTTFEITYPDRPHNAETLLVHPHTGITYVITKDIEQTQVFALDQEQSTLREVFRFSFSEYEMEGSPLVTGGDISPDGNILFIRTYTHIWAVPAHILDGVPMEEVCTMPSASEAQGESITVLDDGRYITISEGDFPTIHQFAYEIE